MSEEEGDSNTQATGNDGDLIEPNKAKHKIIRVLTVIAYTLSVSMAAILLSIYYVFMWDGHPTLARKGPPGHPYTLPIRTTEELTNVHNISAISAQMLLDKDQSARWKLTTVGAVAAVTNNNNVDDESLQKQKRDLYNENDVVEHLVDVLYEPTAIPVVEAKTEVPTPPTTDDSLLDNITNNEDDDSDADPWQPNDNSSFTSKLVEITKRSPMLKKLLLNKIMD